MYDILKAIAASNGWVFDYGRADFQNLHEASEQKEVSHLFLDPVDIKKNRNDSGGIESYSFTGSFMFLYSSDFDEKSYIGRYEKYIKPIIEAQIEIIENDLICIYEANFENWIVKEVINMFNYNFDGVLVPYTVTINADIIENFITTYELTTEAGVGGAFIPEYTNEPFNVGTKVSLYVDTEEGYNIDEVTVNNTPVTTNPFIVTMNEIKKAVATFSN